MKPLLINRKRRAYDLARCGWTVFNSAAVAMTRCINCAALCETVAAGNDVTSIIRGAVLRWLCVDRQTEFILIKLKQKISTRKSHRKVAAWLCDDRACNGWGNGHLKRLSTFRIHHKCQYKNGYGERNPFSFFWWPLLAIYDVYNSFWLSFIPVPRKGLWN